MSEFNLEINGIKVTGSYRLDANVAEIVLEEPCKIKNSARLPEGCSIEDYISELVSFIRLVYSHKDRFRQVYNGYKTMDVLLVIQYFKRVFYSETERRVYIDSMNKTLFRTFCQLYQRHIDSVVDLDDYRIIKPYPLLLKQVLMSSDKSST